MAPSTGGIGTVSFLSAVAWIGPRSMTFSFRVKENPPIARPRTPSTINTMPTTVLAFIDRSRPEFGFLVAQQRARRGDHGHHPACDARGLPSGRPLVRSANGQASPPPPQPAIGSPILHPQRN